MAVAGNLDQAVQRCKDKITKIYDITNLGDLHWFLRMEIKHDVVCTISNQRDYIESMAMKFRLTTAKPVYIPLLPSEILSHDQLMFTPAQHAKMLKVPCGNMIGHVLWPVMISRPDAMFATGILSQFIMNPGPAHIKALKHLITYLYTKKDCWLTFSGKDAEIIAYMDTDYAQQSDHHSILAYCPQFRAGTISWSLKKQNIVALLLTEAEYIGHTHTAKKIM